MKILWGAGSIAVAFLASGLASGIAQATVMPVDLSGWVSEGQGNWAVQPDNNSVLQTTNGSPTVFYQPGTNAQGTALSGTIRVNIHDDDDYIGFVLGYQTGELRSASANYILIDWKKGNQQAAKAGLAISLVTDGSLTDNFWAHANGVTEIERAATLGNTGWVTNTEYAFDIIFNADLIQVFVDGNLELNTTAAEAGLDAFDDGAFAFYNYSQRLVYYSALQERPAPPPSEVPLPATAFLLLPGLAGVALMRRRQRSR